jgi:ankyrin repeat protein
MGDTDFPDELTDEFHRERLHFAAGEGDLGRVQQYLAEGCDPSAFDELGLTPLHYAARGEHFDVVTLLLKRGARINACDVSRAGDSVLADVAQTCSLAMAQLLIDAGADPTTPGGMGMNALHRSATRKRDDGPAVHALLCRAAGRAVPNE